MINPEQSHEQALDAASEGIQEYLERNLRDGRLAQRDFGHALDSVVPNLRNWLLDPVIDELSPNLKPAIRAAIDGRRWEELVNAYVREVEFGTGGIRALMASDYDSVERLKVQGLDASIIKGPNTINNIVVLKAAYGVARFLVESRDYVGEESKPKVVVGYDSRVRGASFAKAVAELLLSHRVHVYLFDEPVPYPEVTFAIPTLGADAGIFISASHNDYRYNGFKMSGANGAQFPAEHRAAVIKHIRAARPLDLRAPSLESAAEDDLARLHFLGGRQPLDGAAYYGRETGLLDIHSAHAEHIKGFLLRKDERGNIEGGGLLKIVYAAFNGAGRRAVPRILTELGCLHVHSIRSLDPLDGLFPAFDHRPGLEQQPDPGDPRAAEVALAELAKDVDSNGSAIPWGESDLLIGTDPDADRCGVVVGPPRDLRACLEARPSVRATTSHVLIPADDVWALLLWYRLEFERERSGRVLNADEKFIALSHTTSDMVARVAAKNGLGVLKTWVGFGWLATGVAEAWKGDGLPAISEGRPPRAPRAGEPTGECDLVFYDTCGMDVHRTFNVGTFEQSNGFSILGRAPERPHRSLGTGGHVRDKDGTLAALLVTEIAAYAKRMGTDILSLVAERLYCDPDVGLFVNYYEPDPIDGEYPGLEGSSKKRRILEQAVSLCEQAATGHLKVGGRNVIHALRYHTGKYDIANNWVGTADNGWDGFPDEGIRFYLGFPWDHITVRPSGTTNSLRFHVQLYGGVPERQAAWPKRLDLEEQARGIVDEVRALLGALRAPGARI